MKSLLIQVLTSNENLHLYCAEFNQIIHNFSTQDVVQTRPNL